MRVFESFLTRAMSKRLPCGSVKLPDGLEKGDAFQLPWRGLAQESHGGLDPQPRRQEDANAATPEASPQPCERLAVNICSVGHVPF